MRRYRISRSAGKPKYGFRRTQGLPVIRCARAQNSHPEACSGVSSKHIRMETPDLRTILEQENKADSLLIPAHDNPERRSSGAIEPSAGMQSALYRRPRV